MPDVTETQNEESKEQKSAPIVIDQRSPQQDAIAQPEAQPANPDSESEIIGSQRQQQLSQIRTQAN